MFVSEEITAFIFRVKSKLLQKKLRVRGEQKITAG
jgi:hypothetical protein